MTSYLPNPASVQAEMLQALGLTSMDDLFTDVPAHLRYPILGLPDGLSELALQRELSRLAAKNLPEGNYPSFLGAGAYDHFIPTALDQLLLRSEFYTAYTPYQAEISQGILQSIFEYQSLICNLTGMAVANASVYDGSTALAEACNVAVDATRRRRIVIPDNLHPAYQAVLATYAQSGNFELQLVPSEAGQAAAGLAAAADRETAAVVVQQPNFLGILESDLAALAERVHQQKALLIMVVDPISLGLLRPPAAYGADLVVGEGQPLGMPLSFGGPYLGFLASSAQLMRRIPGRLVGQTEDALGQRAFVLTLQAREQHIRREKASSNLCSNQALNALASSIYLALIGPRGLQSIAERGHQLALYAADRLAAVGVPLLHPAPFLREFAVKMPDPAGKNRELLQQGIIGGYELPGAMLLAFTEKRTKEEIDRLVAVLGGTNHE